VYGGFEHHSLGALAPDLRDRLIIIDGVSKTYAMTGWRIGWSISPPRVAQALATVQGQSTTNPAAVAQAAAVAALRGPRESVETMRKKFESRRTLMVEALRTVPGVRCRMPEGAFYAFPDVSALYDLRDGDTELENDDQVAMWLLREAHAATVAGTPFGAPGYLRFSYACSEEDIRGGVAAFARAVEAARGRVRINGG
jgi:aspartate aminotransferase